MSRVLEFPPSPQLRKRVNPNRPIFGDPKWIERRGEPYHDLPSGTVITTRDAINAGCCVEGVEEFARTHLKGRTSATIAELRQISSGHTRAWLGTVTEYVKRHAPCWFCSQRDGEHAAWCVEKRA